MPTTIGGSTISFNSGSVLQDPPGNAPSYTCRAWVNWNGTGSAIRASGNVTSITSPGTGQYTVNFATAMPDANYAVAGTANSNAYTLISAYLVFALRFNNSVNSLSTTSCGIISGNNNAESFLNGTWMTVAFYR